MSRSNESISIQDYLPSSFQSHERTAEYSLLVPMQFHLVIKEAVEIVQDFLTITLSCELIVSCPYPIKLIEYILL